MASTQVVEKVKWDDKLKDESARKVLLGEISFEEMRRRLKVQSYQLDAWIGQYARKHWNEEKRRPPSSQEEQQALGAVFQSLMAGKRLDKEQERQLLELYVRKFLHLDS